MFHRVVRLAAMLVMTAAALCPLGGAAQAPAITSDGTMGTTVSPPVNGVYTISDGTLKGSNLFHSFQQFNVPASGRATFTGPSTTQNILSRVTGGHSTIQGVISSRVAMPNANFFLINPSGVTFSAGTQIDVGGSFRVATADKITLADGAVFSARPGAGDALLSSAPPHAFGFLGSAPMPILVDRASLSVGPGQTLSLIAGEVRIAGGGARVLAPADGRVEIGSVASPGDAVIGAGTLSLDSFERLGPVTVSSGAFVAAGFVAGRPGTVVIHAGNLVVDAALLFSRTNAVSGAPLGLDVRARGPIELKNGAEVFTESRGAGNASGMSIVAGSLAVTTGAVIESRAVQAGQGGDIGIQVGSAEILGGAIRSTATASAGGNITLAATGTVMLSGATSEISTGAFSPSFTGGNLSLSASDVILRDRAQIRSGGVSGEPGKNVSITARNSVLIESLAGISSQAFANSAGTVEITAPRLIMDAGFINTSTLGAGNAGQIRVKADTVRLTQGAQIASSSQLGASGAGGSIAIDAQSLAIRGDGPAAGGVGSITFTNDPSSGIFSTTSGRGNAGSISVLGGGVTLADRAKISVTTTGAGRAGTILVDVGSLSIRGAARIDTSTLGAGAGGAIRINGTLSITGLGSGLFSTASSTGDAGSIRVSAPSTTIAEGGTIDSSTTGAGAGGAIRINGSLAITGQGSGLFSTASSTGDAGSINVSAPSLTIASGGTIDSSTTGAGAGGAIDLAARSQVGIFDGATVRADSLGAGNTGSITIAAGDRIMMNNGSISTRAVTSDGGNITLRAPNVIRLGNSQITTSVESGTGAGGNIFIDPQFVILQGSTITANAFGGPGGSITIIADNFLSDATSSVTASSALSTPGTVTIQSPENNLKEAIAQLPGDLVDASRLLRGACSARQTGAPSSFAVAGRGGVPADADSYLSSFSTTGAPLARAARQEQHDQGFVLAMASLDCAR